VEADELRTRIAAFPRWHYRFDFDGAISTPVSNRGLINRQRQRYSYFFERLLSVTGGSLSGRRVLDLGCNAGFWSLAASESGAEFVLGVDLSEEYIEQAKLVFEAKGVARERHRFIVGDVLSERFDRPFDVVLCLGVIDQLDRPAELFELISATGARLVVIDTIVSRARTSLFEMTRLYDARNAAGDGLVLIPSRSAVSDLAARHGFRTVALAQNITDYSGMGDYRRERRCAFICSRGEDLGSLPAEHRPRLIPWWVRDPRALPGA
jgi:SAM-dependent methyltransferase